MVNATLEDKSNIGVRDFKMAGSGRSFKEDDLLNKLQRDPAVFIIPNPCVELNSLT